MKSQPIIIVGGGIGGMTCALALAMRNIASVVLEQAPFFRETGAGILLCPNVFKVFDMLGIKEEMTQIASFPESLHYVDGITGFEFLNIPMGKEIEKRYSYPYGSFHREELLRKLVEMCQKSPQIQLVTSAKVVEVFEMADSVFVKTEKGEKFKGEALIGCDGLWSIVRKYVLDDKAPIASGHITHRGVVAQSMLPEALRPCRVIHWDRPDAHLVQYPIGKKGLFNIVAVYHSAKPFDVDAPDEIDEKFAGSRPEIMQLLTHVDRTKRWMMYDREPLHSWSKGRMTLLGDAAHPTLPHLTQGAGMAIEDAIVLAEMIAKHGGDYTAAFKAYEKARYLRTAHVQLFSRAYGEVHHLSGVARELRNQILAKRTVEENYDWLGMIYKGIEL